MTVLDEIIAGVLDDLEIRRLRCPVEELEARFDHASVPVDVLAALRRPGLGVIAEVKRSSPSKGALATIDDPAQLALEYEAGGATAVSVLTEERRFGGSLADLAAVRAAVATPVLRKDFVVTEYQLIESRAAGADLVLLIVAALTDSQLAGFLGLARELGLTCLVETHTVEELRRATSAGAELIGVNNRDLKTLEVDLNRFCELAETVQTDALLVAESGILRMEDAVRMRDAGAHAVLVGEMLVRSPDPRSTVGALRALT